MREASARSQQAHDIDQRTTVLRGLGLLDAPAEERFDRLTRIARHLLQVPVALISILDTERQFFLSAQGLAEPWASLRQMPLSPTLFPSVVETGLPLAVADTRTDLRVRSNSAIKELGAVACMAVPLALPDGCFVGVLCGIDHRPRTWTAAEEAVLRDLAGAVEVELATMLRLREAETDGGALREDEARCQALFEVSPQAVWFADAAGRCTYVNQYYTDFVGLPAERALGDGWLAAVHPEDRAGASAAWAGAVASEGSYEVEYRIRRGADGAYRWFLVRGAPLRGPGGGVECWIGVGIDIDDRRRTEEALRASEERFRRAMGIGTVGVLFFRLDGRITDANAAFERMSSYARDELLALKGWEVLTPPEFMGATARAAAELAERGKTAPYEKQMVRKDGSRWWGLFAPTRLSGSGRDSQCVEFVIDVTERKRAEEAWRRFAALADSSGEFIGMCDTRLVPFYVNAAGLRLVGLDDLEQARQTPVLEFFFPEDRTLIRDDFFPRIMRDGRGEIETRFRHFKTGAMLWVIYSVVALADEHGRLVGYGTVTRDITERKRAEEALRANEERLRLIVESARDYAIFTTDPQDRIADWMPGASAVYGWSAEEAVGRPGAVLFTPEDREAGAPAQEVETARREGIAPNVRWHLRKDGARVFIEGSTRTLRRPDGSVQGFLKIGQDVTERRRAEEALRASERRLADELSDAKTLQRNQH